MARYIDAEVLQEKIARMIDYCLKDFTVRGSVALFQVADAIMDTPTADVAPVVHGRWEEKPIEYTYFDTKLCSISYVCSVCCENRRFGLGAGNYCPNCGAKMDLE